MNKCDRNELSSIPKWYRFSGAAGTMMPTSSVPVRYCGTHAPGWMNGKHPSKNEGAVSRKVCFHWSNNVCLWNTQITVRNCGSFYVYKLPRTPHCSLRYCGTNAQSKWIAVCWLYLPIKLSRSYWFSLFEWQEWKYFLIRFLRGKESKLSSCHAALVDSKRKYLVNPVIVVGE